MSPRAEMTEADLERIRACQQAVGYTFHDRFLLEKALTHSSVKADERPSYERMEFLGDSVLGLIIAEFLFKTYRGYDEGELTRIKSFVVSTTVLRRVGKHLHLDRYMTVGRGLALSKQTPRTLLADCFEAVVGAIYLDGGYEPAAAFVLRHLRPYIEAAHEELPEKNYKSMLQNHAQRAAWKPPVYKLLHQIGPDHSKIFKVVAVVAGKEYYPAWGKSKKEAEQKAAKIALDELLRAEDN
ncbi:MAG: ribonuclease III [Planctomycetota bacterium]